MNFTQSTRVAALLSCLVLAACGGGGDSGDATVSNSTTLSGSGSGLLPTTTSQQTSGTAVLPLEVMGGPGSIVSVAVPASAGATTATLQLEVNDLEFENEASVQLNSGAWVNLSNAAASVQGAAKAYGGIGGGYNTMTMTVPLKGGVNGMNTLRFRFNGTDGVTAGFRVLAFNLLTSGGSPLVAATQFTQDDPATWTPPLAGAADIAAGANLWKTATLVGSSLPGAATLKAHCMDCHSANGRDLQHFNYSNNSIVVRSEFHGLNEQQGKQIASYIRSLTASYGQPGANCRPWNPPYQPGPGLDSQPVANWSCGAGLQSVKDDDLDSLDSVFPNGINAQAIATGGHLNQREIPIGLQLLDWNHWLPRIHPKDAWGDYFTNSVLNKRYAGEGTGSSTYNMRDQLTQGGSAYVTNASSSFFNDLYYWGTALSEQFLPPGWTGTNASIPIQQKMYSTLQWQMVKNWELAQDFNLESQCPQNYAGQGSKKVEARSWCSLYRFAFNVSPHILGFPASPNMFGSAVASEYTSNVWYENQLLLNSGSGMHNEHLPVDWQYAYGVLGNLGQLSGRQEPIRNLIYVVKGTQEADNGSGAGVADPEKGWTFRIATPLQVWSTGKSGIWAGAPDATRTAVNNAYLSTWLDRSESYPASTWLRIDGANGDNWCGWSAYRLCWADYVPGTLRGTAPLTAENFPTWSFTQIPQMRADGIDGTMLNRFAQLMQNLYPSGGYASLKQ